MQENLYFSATANYGQKKTEATVYLMSLERCKFFRCYFRPEQPQNTNHTGNPMMIHCTSTGIQTIHLALQAGADPVVLLTDALNLALVGGSGGILPREILKSRTSEMRFPAF
jgi:hypothetical protein